MRYGNKDKEIGLHWKWWQSKTLRYHARCRCFFPPNWCHLSVEDGGQMHCKVVLQLCQGLSQTFILPPTSQSNSSSLGPLRILQQHDFTACTNYNIMGPSSIAFPLFCQNYFPLFVFSSLSGSLHVTRDILYPCIAVTFHHMLLLRNLAASLSFGIHLPAPVVFLSDLVPPFAAVASIFWH